MMLILKWKKFSQSTNGWFSHFSEFLGVWKWWRKHFQSVRWSHEIQLSLPMKLHSNGLKGIPFPPKSLGAECLKQVISEVERLVEQAVHLARCFDSHLARCFDSLVSLSRIYYVYGKEPNNAQKSLLNSLECIRRDTLNKKVVCLKAVEGFSQTIHVMSLSASLSFAKLWLENTCVGSIAWRTPAIPTPCKKQSRGLVVQSQR